MKYFLALLAVLTCLAAAPKSSYAMNCVAYAKRVTGLHLNGDAWHWWDSASGLYARGHQPRIGAVLVFQRTRNMRHGHVAIVRAIRGAREILIDQANWARGIVTRAVSVIDVSARNDWSSVAVQWQRSASYGRPNPISGFIYAGMRR